MNSTVFRNMKINSFVILTLNNGSVLSGRFVQIIDGVIQVSGENGSIFYVDYNNVSIVEVNQDNGNEENSLTVEDSVAENLNDLDDIDWFGRSISEQEMWNDFERNTEHENKLIAQLTNHEDIQKIIENGDRSFDKKFAIERYNELLGKHLLEISELDQFYEFRQKHLAWIQKYNELEEIMLDKKEYFVEFVTSMIEKTSSVNELNEIAEKYKGLINFKVKSIKQKLLIQNEISLCKNLIKLEQLRRKFINTSWNEEMEGYYESRKIEIIMNSNVK